ncbi:MAG TPA: cell wall hydrolase [Sphingomicrobium sp.]|nr:cell wall hydrolase [Sphingomicrobium sp.]
MKKFALGRGLAAVAGLFVLAASNPATAAPLPTSGFSAGASVRPLGALTPVVTTVANAVSSATTAALATVTGGAVQAPPAALAAPSIATEAAWLQRNGWPLYALVDRYSAGAPLGEEANCIAVAVYHEARGESLEGQLAVARVIMNRAASGRYPGSWCAVVKQPWQFSFVNPRSGRMPGVDEDSVAWRRALGVTRLAINNAVTSVPTDCLWYHADYVAPSWGRRLQRVSQIGAHIFYRS